MKYLKYIFLILAGTFISTGVAYGAQILFPGGGGTGWGFPGGIKAHTVLIGNGTSQISTTSPSTSGFVLTSNGVNADPTFQAVPGSFAWPFTPTSYGVSTSTIIGFLNGFFTTASTTFSQLSTGAVYDQNGLILAHATTSSSVASQDVWRDANQNAFAQNFVSAGTSFPTNGATVTLTNASPRNWIFTGTLTQTMQLPAGTTLSVGATYTANNNSTQSITVVDNGSNVLATVIPGGKAEFVISDVSTANGTWEAHALLGHSNISGTNNLGIGTSTIYANLTVWGSSLGKALEVSNSASTTVLSVSNTGFGTTTLAGLNISGSATSTSNVGYNITTGCYAIGGSCIGGSGGGGTVTSIATTWPITGGTITTSGTLTWGGLATTSQPASSNLIVSNGVNGLYGVATSTLTASSPLTGSFTQIGSGGSVGCTTASSGVAGCLSNTAFDTFNNKQNAITATWPQILTGSTLTFGGLSTSSSAVLGNIPYFSGVNTFANVATSTVTPATPLNGSFTVIGSSGTLGWSGLATSSAGVIGNIPYFSSASGLANVATGTITCTGTASCGAGSYVIGSNLTITGSASGVAGVGTVSTSSTPTIGNLAFWTSSGGYPEKLGTVATTTLGVSGPLNVTSGIGTLVGGSNATIGWTGLATSSTGVISNIPYFSSVSGLANVATTSLTASSPISITAGNGALIGGVNATLNWSGLATSSAGTISNLLYYSSASGVANVATSSLGVTAPITFSGTIGAQVGGVGGSFGCTNASSGVTGCLTGTDWNTFNGKESVLSFTWPLIRSSNTITFGGLSTSSAITAPQVLYATGVNTMASVATSTLSVGSSLSTSGTLGFQIGGTNSSLSINLGNTNSWTAIQNFWGAASSSLFSGNWAAFGGSATTTINTAGQLLVATTTPWLNSQVNIVGTTTIASGQLVNITASTTAASTQNIDWSTGTFQDIMLTANTNIVINSTSSNPIDGGRYIMRVCQDPTGSRTLTWANPIAIRWGSSGTTTISSTANTCTMFGMVYTARNGNKIYSMLASTTGISIQ